jgi:hypothetical protein
MFTVDPFDAPGAQPLSPLAAALSALAYARALLEAACAARLSSRAPTLPSQPSAPLANAPRPFSTPQGVSDGGYSDAATVTVEVAAPPANNYYGYGYGYSPYAGGWRLGSVFWGLRASCRRRAALCGGGGGGKPCMCCETPGVPLAAPGLPCGAAPSLAAPCPFRGPH